MNIKDNNRNITTEEIFEDAAKVPFIPLEEKDIFSNRSVLFGYFHGFTRMLWPSKIFFCHKPKCLILSTNDHQAKPKTKVHLLRDLKQTNLSILNEFSHKD